MVKRKASKVMTQKIFGVKLPNFFPPIFVRPCITRRYGSTGRYGLL